MASINIHKTFKNDSLPELSVALKTCEAAYCKFHGDCWGTGSVGPDTFSLLHKVEILGNKKDILYVLLH